MPHDKTETVFYFAELEDDAKEKARDWYRTGALDYEWWDCVYEDAITCAAILGIEIEKIYFSGFSSQGDGACFEGTYAYAKGSAKAIRQHAPKDIDLASIADRLQDLQRGWFYGLSASVKQSGHYMHEMCTQISVYDDQETTGSSRNIVDADEDLTGLLREYMQWIYSNLMREYEWLMSDEQVDESITINEYEFNEDGSIA